MHQHNWGALVNEWLGKGAAKDEVILHRRPKFQELWVSRWSSANDLLLTCKLKVPQQPNSVDCGLYTIYFARAALEAPEWVMARAVECRKHVQEHRTAAEGARLRSMWGTPAQIAKVRWWMLHTLCDWIDQGEPHVRSLMQ